MIPIETTPAIELPKGWRKATPDELEALLYAERYPFTLEQLILRARKKR